MQQLIDFPAHVRGNTLDVLFTHESHNITSIENIGNIGNSDHSALLLLISEQRGLTTIFLNFLEIGETETKTD